MLLPNKLFSYNQSVLSKLPAFMKSLDTPKYTRELYQLMKAEVNSPIEFIEVLDCLYALHKIDLDDNGRIFKC